VIRRRSLARQCEHRRSTRVQLPGGQAGRLGQCNVAVFVAADHSTKRCAAVIEHQRYAGRAADEVMVGYYMAVIVHDEARCASAAAGLHLDDALQDALRRGLRVCRSSGSTGPFGLPDYRGDRGGGVGGNTEGNGPAADPGKERSYDEEYGYSCYRVTVWS
jgi:hypothetical protein